MDVGVHDLGQPDLPLLVFGGNYSNLAATLAIQAEAERRGLSPAQVICTGDVVAYCAEPQATVDLMRDWGVTVVMGNCEESLGFGQDDCGCGYGEGSRCDLLAQEWYAYSREHLDAQSRAWMRGLPRALTFSVRGLRFRVVHGSVSAINRFVFASTPGAIKERELMAAQAEVVIGGHCGLPFGQCLQQGYWLNAGAIGLPANDGSRDGWYMVIEEEGDGLCVSWHRLSYDAEKARSAMAAAGLSPHYATALTEGLWPSLEVLPEVERGQRGRLLGLPPLTLACM